MSEIESEMEYVLRNSCERAEEKVKELQKRLDYASYSIIQLNSVGEKYKEKLRHSNYKRCLAMASYWVAVSYQCVDNKHRQRAEKHHYKWLELAEKFKEAK